jgi:hypothetical protein
MNGFSTGVVPEMVMFRSLFFTGALLAAGVACAQEVAISGKDFLSGAGDAKIAELARQAAASGKTLLISAPPYWQDKAASKVHAGAANATVRMSDAFFENVMVRVEDSKASAKTVEAPAPAPAPKAAPSKPEPPRPEPKPVEPKAAPPMPKPAPVETPVAPKPAPVEVPPPPVKTEVAPAPAPVAAPPPVVTPPPPPAPAPAPAAKAQAPADPSIAIKQRMAQNLNAGQPAEGTLQVAQLQKDDLLFVDGPVRAVVRRFGPRTQLFWLEGDLNLERAELVPTGNDRYRISQPIRNVSNPSLRGSTKSGALKLTFNVPAPKSPARIAIERQYNDGRDIVTNLTPAELRQGDLVYTGEGSAVVVRRTSVGVERHWLVGELDMHQSGLQTQGNAIRVLTDTIK